MREEDDLCLSLMHAYACGEGKKRVRGEVVQVRLSSHFSSRQNFRRERERERQRLRQREILGESERGRGRARERAIRTGKRKRERRRKKRGSATLLATEISIARDRENGAP